MQRNSIILSQRVHRLAVLAMLSVATHSLCQQTAAPAQVTKDPTAIAVAQKALLAMGGTSLAAYQDSYATGNVTLYTTTGSQSYPAVLRSKGLNEFRYEIQKKQGTDTYTTDGGDACIRRADGTTQFGSTLSLYTQRIDFIPALSILANYTNSTISVQYGGATSVNGSTADVITLSVNINAPPGVSGSQLDQRTIFVDQTTSLVTKIQGYQFDDSNPGYPTLIEMYFLNYQIVNGIAVPFTRLTALSGNSSSLLALSSLTFNTGLSDSLFDSTCGVQNAQ
jgi:hypothetical protein